MEGNPKTSVSQPSLLLPAACLLLTIQLLSPTFPRLLPEITGALPVGHWVVTLRRIVLCKIIQR